MTTLSPTKARSNLTAWLKKAAAGEDIGILFGDQVIALRPVEVESTDYAQKEYNVTKEDLKYFADTWDAKIKKNHKSEKIRVYTGDIEDLLKD